jgi:hypothetical protein
MTLQEIIWDCGTTARSCVAPWPVNVDGQAAEDPIFPIIAACKQALIERMSDSDHIEQPRVADLCDHEFEAFHRLFDTSPTTVSGAALLDQLAANPYNDEHMTGPQSVIEMAFDMDRNRTNAALAGLAASLCRISTT